MLKEHTVALFYFVNITIALVNDFGCNTYIQLEVQTCNFFYQITQKRKSTNKNNHGEFLWEFPGKGCGTKFHARKKVGSLRMYEYFQKYKNAYRLYCVYIAHT